MKIERMLYIVNYLLENRRVKAKDLAQQLEVSLRTIYRDVEAIEKAGIPIITSQGMDGGISIMDGYKLNSSLLDVEDITNIITALKGLNSVSDDGKLNLLIDRLDTIKNSKVNSMVSDEIIIDLSPWDNRINISQNIDFIKASIKTGYTIEFEYASYSSRIMREVEPLCLVFKSRSWYLYAYCLVRNDFRLFKISRMKELRQTQKTFVKREFEHGWVEFDEKHRGESYKIIFVAQQSLEFVLWDIFDESKIKKLDDDKLEITFESPIDEQLYSFFLGFIDSVEVKEPVELKEGLLDRANRIARIYNTEMQ